MVHSSGVIIDAEGEKHQFTAQDIIMENTEKYKSSFTNAEYPVSWNMEIPKINLKIKLKPALKEQEHQLSYPYYEGAVELAGHFADAEVTGKGYMELVGY